MRPVATHSMSRLTRHATQKIPQQSQTYFRPNWASIHQNLTKIQPKWPKMRLIHVDHNSRFWPAEHTVAATLGASVLAIGYSANLILSGMQQRNSNYPLTEKTHLEQAALDDSQERTQEELSEANFTLLPVTEGTSRTLPPTLDWMKEKDSTPQEKQEPLKVEEPSIDAPNNKQTPSSLGDHVAFGIGMLTGLTIKTAIVSYKFLEKATFRDEKQKRIV